MWWRKKLTEEIYQPMQGSLAFELENIVATNDFQKKQNLLRSLLFINVSTDTALVIDHNICDKKYPFSYTEYTKEQNALMHKYRSVYRFVVDNSEDLKIFKEEFEHYIQADFSEDKIKSSGANRQLVEIDPTLPEAYFEQAFIETYGRESLDKVEREFPVIDIKGQTRWIDYLIRHKNYNIAIEKNGETYHHPIITGKKRYQSQLVKQNSGSF